MQVTIRVNEHSIGTTCEVVVTLDPAFDGSGETAARILDEYKNAIFTRSTPPIGEPTEEPPAKPKTHKALNALGAAVLALVKANPEASYTETDALWEQTGARTERAYHRAVTWLITHGYLVGDDAARRYVPLA